MIRFVIRIFGNSVALYIAAFFVHGFIVVGGIKELLIAGVILGLLNTLVKPVLRMISMPVIILTLGIFTLVINALMLWAVDYIFDFIQIQDLYSLVWATIIVSLVNAIISGASKST